MEVTTTFWIVFNLSVLVVLGIDLFVFHKDAHAVSLKEAGIWSAIWIILSLFFCAGIYFYAGSQPALEFLTAYVIEKSLSVDNIFVFVLIFLYFKVSTKYQHTVLFWGVLGAIVMRGVFITVGVYLFERFHWIIYVFGAFLVYTGIRMALEKEDEAVDLENNRTLRLLRRIIPMTSDYREGRFFVHEGGRRLATPLFLVLIMVEMTDLIFAVDSVPAVLAITPDYFLAYTSNIMAILGLRALYFLLAGVIDKFHYLKLGLAIILSFVGVKMLIAEFYHMPVSFSLLFIAVVLTASIVASLMIPRKERSEEPPQEPAPGAGLQDSV